MNRTEKIIQRFIDDACKNKVSDIHFQPLVDGGEVSIYYRKLGERKFVRSIKLRTYQTILSYLKYNAHMDISNKLIPQNGKLEFVTSFQIAYSLRISTLPLGLEEALTIRLLPQDDLNIDDLFIYQHQFNEMKSWLYKKSGLLLFTGPTGCGKSTTMYALLQAILKENSYQVVTLEDPIERKLDNVIQVEMNERAGVTYYSALKAALRHDPDIIMIGEIRDESTASFAIRAALTGHLVLSTIHAKDAASTVHRLLDLDIHAGDILQTIVGVASIQLVPTYIDGVANRRAIAELLYPYHIEEILNGGQDVQFETFATIKEKPLAEGYMVPKQFIV